MPQQFKRDTILKIVLKTPNSFSLCVYICTYMHTYNYICICTHKHVCSDSLRSEGSVPFCAVCVSALVYLCPGWERGSVQKRHPPWIFPKSQDRRNILSGQLAGISKTDLLSCCHAYDSLCTCFSPFLELNKVEGPSSRVPTAACTCKLLSGYINTGLNASFKLNPLLVNKNQFLFITDCPFRWDFC